MPYLHFWHISVTKNIFSEHSPYSIVKTQRRDSLARSQCPEDCVLSQIRISILYMIQIKLTNSSSIFFSLQTQNMFREKSSFLTFNILCCLWFGIQSIFGAYCLTGLKIISCDSRDLLFWNCHYFLEQPLCTAANMPWILLLHITVILLCQGRIQPHRAGVSLC